MRDDIKKAVAIEYDIEHAPKINAKGKGIVAQNILKRAEDTKIPIYKDSELAEELTQLDIGQEIPAELYEIVAEILVFVNDIDKLGEKIHAKKKQP